MKPLGHALLCLALTHSAIAYASNWVATQLSYQATGWNTGHVYGLNNLGQVVGAINPPPFLPGGGFIEAIPMAFVTAPGGGNLQPIVPSYQPYAEHCSVGCNPYPLPTAINNAGQITMATQPVSLSTQAYVSLMGPSGRDIPPPVSAETLGATAYLNSSGQVAGTFDTYIGFVSYMTGANGTNPHLLSVLDSNLLNWNRVYGINDSGQLLVSGTPVGTTETKTFVTSANGSGIAFETHSLASGLNSSAQIIGAYSAAVGGEQRAFVTGANGVGFIDLGSLGGETFASAINNKGLVTGSSGGRAFVYGLNGGGIRDLNQLVTLRPGEFFTDAPDINDRGQIVAESNQGHLYLLSPVPEPTPYLMFGAGLAVLCWRNRPYVSRETPA